MYHQYSAGNAHRTMNNQDTELMKIIECDDIGLLKSYASRQSINLNASSPLEGTNYLIDNKKSKTGYLQNSGLSLLHVAAYYNSIECFRYLIEVRHMPYDKPDAESYEPMHFACLGGAIEVITYILEHHPEEGKKETNTPHQFLFFATISGNPDIITLLFHSGCNPKSNKNKADAPIKKAVELHLIDSMKVLLVNQAKIENFDSDTALMFAIRRSEYSAVPILLDAGEDASVIVKNTISHENDSALKIACIQQSLSSVSEICMRIGSRINPSQKEMMSNFPVHWICMSCKSEIAKIVLTCNIDVNALDKNRNQGPIFMIGRKQDTSSEEKVKILDMLYEKGFMINNPAANGPILSKFIGAITPEKPLIEWFIKHGADVHVPYTQGQNQTIYEKAMMSPSIRDIFEKYAPPPKKSKGLLNKKV